MTIQYQQFFVQNLNSQYFVVEQFIVEKFTSRQTQNIIFI